MLYFIIGASLAFGLFMGLKTAHTATVEGESVADARLHGVLGGVLCAVFAAWALFLAWGVGMAYWHFIVA